MWPLGNVQRSSPSRFSTFTIKRRSPPRMMPPAENSNRVSLTRLVFALSLWERGRGEAWRFFVPVLGLLIVVCRGQQRSFLERPAQELQPDRKFGFRKPTRNGEAR